MQEMNPEKENDELEMTEPVESVNQEPSEAADGEGTTLLGELEDQSESEYVENDVEMDDDLSEALDRVARLEQENEALKTRVLRAQADMENYRKRSERERLDSIKYANKRIFLELLEVIDNFDRALTAVTDPKDNFVIGVNMIHKQLTDVLSQNGVEEINPAGRLFDPYLDEALAQEVTTEHEENMVIEVFQKGFRFQGTLLRPSKVKVAATAAKEADETEADEPASTDIDLNA